MSAVVSFVADVVESVVDAVGDVVETVVDVVGDVVETVGDTVQAIIDDPLPTLLSIAGSAIGIPPPVTMAAVTAARGGDLQDIVLSAGAAYLAPSATNAISSTLSSTIGNSIINETVSDIVIDGVSKGLVNGAIAEVRGGDFEDGFAGAFTGTIVNSGVGEFTNEFIKPEIQDMLADSGLDARTINTFVTEGTRAVSSGITAEITGRGDFDDAFVNSVTNSTINVGTNYAVNTIGDQFKNAEEGLRDIASKGGEDDRDMLDFEDYFAMDTTTGTDATGAGIPDDLVEEVSVADTGEDTGSFSDTASANLEQEYLNTVGAADFDEVLGGGDEVLAEFSEEQPSTDVADAGFDFDFDFDALPDYIRDLFDYEPVVAEEEVEEPVGGLNLFAEAPSQVQDSDVVFESGAAQYAPEEAVVSTDIFGDEAPKAESVADLYRDVKSEDFGIPTDGTVDIAESDIMAPAIEGTRDLIEGGLNKVKQSFVDATDPENIKNTLVSGALNQVLRPAIRQGLTKAIRGTPTRQVARRPQPKPKANLTPEQLAMIRSATTAQKPPAQKIDMSKILAKAKTPAYVPPKKVDVTKLTPITNVASLSSILNGGKG